MAEKVVDELQVPAEVDTPDTESLAGDEQVEAPQGAPAHVIEEDQEIGMRDFPLPRHHRHGGLQARMVGQPLTMKPEPYDGKSDWPEYLVYFEQMAEVYG